MHFPQDHRPHTKTEIEWWYAWAKLGDIWIHWALFKKGRKLVLHGSVRRKGRVKFFERRIKKLSDVINISGNRIKIKSPKFSIECIMRDDPIENEGYGRKYYSMTHLIIRGKLRRWLRTVRVNGSGWFDHAWGPMPKKNWEWIAINFYDGTAQMTSKEYDGAGPDKEKIFKPKHGWPYSEQPLLIEKDNRLIGIGMRERTYRRF